MRVKHIITGLLIIVAILAVHGSVIAEGFIGPIGDRIDYSSGALTLSETDVTIPGRRGLDVNIVRSYTTANYLPDVDIIDNPDTHCVYQRPFDSSSNKYMGLGWHIEFPYLTYNDSATTLTNQNGSSEALLVNLDTLTNMTYPRKTRDLSILTNYTYPSATTEVMLCPDGTKLEFGKKLGHRKLMTKMYNRYGDYIEVTYWTNEYIKYVTSPIGLKVHFQYCDEDSVYSLTSSPTDDVRLSSLLWLNHEGDTLRVSYEYNWSKAGLLHKVIHANGDSTMYDYTTDVFYNDVADYWDTAATWADTLSYDDTLHYHSNQLHYMGKITDPGGAQAEYRYRAFMIPTYSGCDHNTFDDPVDEFKNYIGVNRRIADGDTLLIKYELSYPGLEVIEPEMEFAGMVSRVTTVLHPSGGEQEFWYFLDKECGYVLNENLMPWVFSAGYYPGMLYQKHSIFDGDTVCTGYSYGNSLGSGIVTIGDVIDSTGATGYYKAPATFLIHVGVAYYHPDLHFDSLSFTATSSKEWRSTILEKDMDAAGIVTRKIESERLSQWVATDTSYTNKNGLYDATGWIPSPYPSDTLWFTMDSVTAYTYVPSRNLTLADTVWSLFQNDSLVYATYTAYYYNSSNNYVVDSVVATLDPDYSDDTLSRRKTTYEYYSSNGMVKCETDYRGDKTWWEYDTLYNAFTWKETDSALGDLVTYDYYPNGQMKTETGLNGAVTEYYYDSLGRDLGIKMPLEDADDTTIINIYASGNVSGNSAKIDDSTRIVTKSVHDTHFRKVKTILEVDATATIVDSIVMNEAGLIAKQSRAKYADSGSTYWTEYYYDQSTRKVKTVLADGSKDSVRYVDEFTTLYDSRRGQRSISVIDLAGNKLCDSIFEVGDTTSLMGVITYSYDKLGNVIAVTDLEGITRQWEYDDWGRIKKVTDADIGTIECWYDEWSDLR
ncbi:MAG: RHS repeat protein, partial [candidate division Zixibacteria bacterium]|nr:RHS repeat protein [candidate division Zixibacteria bacterium]